MITAPSRTTAFPAHPVALAQRVARQLRTHGRSAEPNPVILVRAEPAWTGDPVLTVEDGPHLRVVPCSSVLAVWEQLAADHPMPCVVLTDIPQDELGIGILSRVFRRRVLDLEPWELISECFGVQGPDPRLEALPWAGRALLEAMPSEGWPRLAGIVLSRDTALRHLAVERLGLQRIAVAADDIEASALLRWSSLPEAPQLVAALPAAERAGLLDWLVEQFGPAVRVLRALLESGHGRDALPLGLVCAALWAADAPEDLRAQGRVEQYLGGGGLTPEAIRSFGATATRTVAELLSVLDEHDDRYATRRLAHQVLDRAEELATGFAATGAARSSRTMRSGFEQRLGVAADALISALAAAAAPAADPALAAAAAAVADLASHQLAAIYPHRVERVRMALRLVRWLGQPLTPPTGVAGWIDRQVAEWGWVDLALGHVWSGEDAHGGLARTYRAVYERVRDRRRELDQAFARQLASWTRRGAVTGDLLTVETVLRRVVAPLVQDGDRPVLFIVVDGMSTAVAADLVAEMTDTNWTEYDPLAGRRAASTPGRRRGAVAALPTVTATSRSSLLAAALTCGGQDSERAAFERLPLWQSRPARLFHQQGVHGDAGEVLSEDLVRALSDAQTVVGVVLNTVDDALDHGRESADASWRIDHVGPLRALLEHARYHGRAVVLVSDHGHVLDRESTLRRSAAPIGARYRTDGAPAGDGEVVLEGSRVVGEDRIVALWDPGLRYLPRRAGYHGGASLAEVTVPVVALLPFGAAAPKGWAPLGAQDPAWWASPDASPRQPADQPSGPAPSQPSGRARRGRRAAPDPAAISLFDLPEASTPPVATEPGPSSLVDALLATEMFHAQHALTARRVPVQKIRGALTALIEANGVLPAVVTVQRAGEQATRAIGFVTTLQRILNVDNFPVLSLTDAGRTVRLDQALLRQQFNLEVLR